MSSVDDRLLPLHQQRGDRNVTQRCERPFRTWLHPRFSTFDFGCPMSRRSCYQASAIQHGDRHGRTPPSCVDVRIAGGVGSMRGQTERQVQVFSRRRACATPRWLSRDKQRAPRGITVHYTNSKGKKTKASNHAWAFHIHSVDQSNLNVVMTTS